MSSIIATHSMKVLEHATVTDEWGEETSGWEEIYSSINCHLSQITDTSTGETTPYATENKKFKIFYPLEYIIPAGCKLELSPLFQGGESYTLLSEPSVAYQFTQKKEMKVSLWQE